MDSFMNRLVGRAPKKPTEEEVTTQAHSSIQDASGSILKRQTELKRQMEDLTNQARRELKAGNKKAALQTMKRKKLVESHLVKLDPHLMNLEVQKITLEGVGTNKAVISAMKSGAAAMKVGMPSIDDVTDTMEDLTELYGDHEEVNDMLGAPLGSALSNMDDDELANELNNLQTDLESEQELAFMDQMTEAPSAPIGKVVSSSSVVLGQEEALSVEASVSPPIPRSVTRALPSSSSSSSSSKAPAPVPMTAAEAEAKHLQELEAFLNS
jgi:hypothetical protein